MEDDDYKLCTVLPDSGNIGPELSGALQMVIQLIDADQPDLDAFDIYDSRFIISKMYDSLCVQSLQGIREALFSVIMAVIIGGIHGFHRTAGEDTRKFSRCLESKLLVLPFFRVCKSAFKIGNGQVVRFKDTFDIGEKIFFAVFIKICIQTGVIIKGFVGSKGTVPDDADGQGNRFFREIGGRNLFRIIVLSV